MYAAHRLLNQLYMEMFMEMKRSDTGIGWDASQLTATSFHPGASWQRLAILATVFICIASVSVRWDTTHIRTTPGACPDKWYLSDGGTRYADRFVELACIVLYLYRGEENVLLPLPALRLLVLPGSI